MATAACATPSAAAGAPHSAPTAASRPAGAAIQVSTLRARAGGAAWAPLQLGGVKCGLVCGARHARTACWAARPAPASLLPPRLGQGTTPHHENMARRCTRSKRAGGRAARRAKRGTRKAAPCAAASTDACARRTRPAPRQAAWGRRAAAQQAGERAGCAATGRAADARLGARPPWPRPRAGCRPRCAAGTRTATRPGAPTARLPASPPAPCGGVRVRVSEGPAGWAAGRRPALSGSLARRRLHQAWQRRPASSAQTASPGAQPLLLGGETWAAHSKQCARRMHCRGCLSSSLTHAGALGRLLAGTPDRRRALLKLWSAPVSTEAGAPTLQWCA